MNDEIASAAELHPSSNFLSNIKVDINYRKSPSILHVLQFYGIFLYLLVVISRLWNTIHTKAMVSRTAMISTPPSDVPSKTGDMNRDGGCVNISVASGMNVSVTS